MLAHVRSYHVIIPDKRRTRALSIDSLTNLTSELRRLTTNRKLSNQCFYQERKHFRVQYAYKHHARVLYRRREPSMKSDYLASAAVRLLPPLPVTEVLCVCITRQEAQELFFKGLCTRQCALEAGVGLQALHLETHE